jgi:hypothetical protein
LALEGLGDPGMTPEQGTWEPGPHGSHSSTCSLLWGHSSCCLLLFSLLPSPLPGLRPWLSREGGGGRNGGSFLENPLRREGGCGGIVRLCLEAAVCSLRAGGGGPSWAMVEMFP